MDTPTVTYLNKFPLFSGLSEDDMLIAEEHMYETRLEAGERLFEEGEEGSFVCFVIDGALEVLKKNSSGKEVCLAELHKGQSIGEMSIIDNLQRSAAVRSVGESRLLVLTRKGFELLEERHPNIAVVILKHFTRMLSHNVRSTSEGLADLMAVSSR
jgi:CRP-like cAMP-binding protein